MEVCEGQVSACCPSSPAAFFFSVGEQSVMQLDLTDTHRTSPVLISGAVLLLLLLLGILILLLLFSNIRAVFSVFSV